jgi:hypothetical protein
MPLQLCNLQARAASRSQSQLLILRNPMPITCLILLGVAARPPPQHSSCSKKGEVTNKSYCVDMYQGPVNFWSRHRISAGRCRRDRGPLMFPRTFKLLRISTTRLSLKFGGRGGIILKASPVSYGLRAVTLGTPFCGTIWKVGRSTGVRAWSCCLSTGILVETSSILCT